VKIVRLSERGAQISGINGRRRNQFSQMMSNADPDVFGINGHVNTELSNVTIQGKMEKK